MTTLENLGLQWTKAIIRANITVKNSEILQFFKENQRYQLLSQFFSENKKCKNSVYIFIELEEKENGSRSLN